MPHNYNITRYKPTSFIKKNHNQIACVSIILLIVNICTNNFIYRIDKFLYIYLIFSLLIKLQQQNLIDWL